MRIYVLTISEKTITDFFSFIPNRRVSFEVFQGFDGRSTEEIEFERYFNVQKFYKRWNYKPGRGEMACAISHHSIYRKIVASKDSFALILEDDFQLNDELGFQEFINNFDNEINYKNFDILVVGYSRFTHKNLKIFNMTNPYVGKAIRYLDWFLRSRRSQTCCGTVGYIISRDYAKRYLESNQTPWFVADQWDEHEALGAKILHLDPPIIWETLGNPDGLITKDREKLKIKVTEPIFEYEFLDYLKYPYRLFKKYFFQITYHFEK